MTRQAAWQHDHGLPAGESSNMAKYAARRGRARRRRRGHPDSRRQRPVHRIRTDALLEPGAADAHRAGQPGDEILNFVAQHSLGLTPVPAEATDGPRAQPHRPDQRRRQPDPLGRDAPSQLAVVDGDHAPDIPRLQRLRQPDRARPGRGSATSAAPPSRSPPATARSSSRSTTPAPSLAWSLRAGQPGQRRPDEVAFVLDHSRSPQHRGRDPGWWPRCGTPSRRVPEGPWT